jgi:hypothetical protein
MVSARISEPNIITLINKLKSRCFCTLVHNERMRGLRQSMNHQDRMLILLFKIIRRYPMHCQNKSILRYRLVPPNLVSQRQACGLHIVGHERAYFNTAYVILEQNAQQYWYAEVIHHTSSFHFLFVNSFKNFYMSPGSLVSHPCEASCWTL